MKRRYRLFLHALVLAAILSSAAPRPPAHAFTPGPRTASSLPSAAPSPAELSRAEPSRAEPSRAEPSRANPSPAPPQQGKRPGESPGSTSQPDSSPQPGKPAEPVNPPDPEKPDLTPRLREIYERRAQRFQAGWDGPPLEDDFLLARKTAQWALLHEKGKYKYVQAWAEARGVRFVEARTKIWVKELKRTEDRARFYVAQALELGYQYPGEETVNRFGVGSRHIVELHRAADGRWLIGLEWYSDPLGDESETPAALPQARPSGAREDGAPHVPATALAARSYDRQGAVAYADTYCGLAAGCGNDHKYNPRMRNYMGEGGDCANFVSQALRYGGKLQMPTFTRADGLIGHLRYSGRGDLVVRGDFRTVWQIAAGKPEGFRAFLKPGDVLGYEEKGKMTHVALITGFDSRGYPLGNSHTADRYRVPFDLGWDKQTIYWFVAMRD